MTPLTGLPCIVRLQNRMESYSPFSTSMHSICRPGGTQKWVSILLDTGEEGPIEDKRKTEDPGFMTPLTGPLQSFALMKERFTRRFHRNLVKVSRRVVVLGKRLLAFCIGTENETGRRPCKIQISWVANPFYPSPAGLAVEGMSTRLEVKGSNQWERAKSMEDNLRYRLG